MQVVRLNAYPEAPDANQDGQDSAAEVAPASLSGGMMHWQEA